MTSALSEVAQLALEAIGERGATMLDVIELLGKEHKPAFAVNELLAARLIKRDRDGRLWRADAAPSKPPLPKIGPPPLELIDEETDDQDDEDTATEGPTEEPAAPAREEPEMAGTGKNVKCVDCGATFKRTAGPQKRCTTCSVKKKRAVLAKKAKAEPAPRRAMPALPPALPVGPLPTLSQVNDAIATLQRFAAGIAGIVQP